MTSSRTFGAADGAEISVRGSAERFFSFASSAAILLSSAETSQSVSGMPALTIAVSKRMRGDEEYFSSFSKDANISQQRKTRFPSQSSAIFTI